MSPYVARHVKSAGVPDTPADRQDARRTVRRAQESSRRASVAAPALAQFAAGLRRRLSAVAKEEPPS